MTTTLVPYLTFAGTTREAYAFYKTTLDARIDAMMRYDQAPPMDAASTGCGPGNTPPRGDAIMHACLTLPGGAQLFAGDAPDGMPFDGMRGVMLTLSYETVEEATRVFHALAEGGQVVMPLASSFWSKTFGIANDRFGVCWAINGAPAPLPT